MNNSRKGNGFVADVVADVPAKKQRKPRTVDTSVEVVRASISPAAKELLVEKELSSKQDRNTIIECAIRAFMELPKEARVKALEQTLAARVKSVNDNI